MGSRGGHGDGARVWRRDGMLRDGTGGLHGFHDLKEVDEEGGIDVLDIQ